MQEFGWSCLCYRELGMSRSRQRMRSESLRRDQPKQSLSHSIAQDELSEYSRRQEEYRYRPYSLSPFRYRTSATRPQSQPILSNCPLKYATGGITSVRVSCTSTTSFKRTGVPEPCTDSSRFVPGMGGVIPIAALGDSVRGGWRSSAPREAKSVGVVEWQLASSNTCR